MDRLRDFPNLQDETQQLLRRKAALTTAIGIANRRNDSKHALEFIEERGEVNEKINELSAKIQARDGNL